MAISILRQTRVESFDPVNTRERYSYLDHERDERITVFNMRNRRVKVRTSIYDRLNGLHGRLMVLASYLVCMHHPNVQRLADVIIRPSLNDQDGVLSVLVVEEPMSADELMGTLTREEQISAAFQLISGAAYIQTQGILHCNYRPENIYVYGPPSQRQYIIGNFDRVRPIDTDDMSRLPVTPYSAPEVLMGLSYDVKAEVWVMGCLLMTLMTGLLPFGNTSDRSALLRAQFNIQEVPRFGEWTKLLSRYEQQQSSGQVAPRVESRYPELQDLLSRMLTIDPVKRQSFASLLRHPCFESLRTSPNVLHQPLEEAPSRHTWIERRPMSPYPQWLSSEMSNACLVDTIRYIHKIQTFDLYWGIIGLAVHMFRTFLGKRDVPTSRVVLYMIAAIAIAGKVEEEFYYRLRILLEPAGTRYTKDEVRRAEQEMLEVYGVDLHRATSCDIVIALLEGMSSSVETNALTLLLFSYGAPMIGISPADIAGTCAAHAHAAEGKQYTCQVSPQAFQAVTRELRVLTAGYTADDEDGDNIRLLQLLMSIPMLADYVPRRLDLRSRISTEYGIPRSKRLQPRRWHEKKREPMATIHISLADQQQLQQTFVYESDSSTD